MRALGLTVAVLIALLLQPALSEEGYRLPDFKVYGPTWTTDGF
jgi:hypothetical protein